MLLVQPVINLLQNLLKIFSFSGKQACRLRHSLNALSMIRIMIPYSMS